MAAYESEYRILSKNLFQTREIGDWSLSGGSSNTK